VQLLLLADTHSRPRPAAVWDAVDRADLVVHAGDWTSVALLDELSSRADVLGCWGNNDGPELRARLPEVAYRTVDGVRLAVVHETGAAAGREARMDRTYDVDVLVFGHSHIPWDTVTPAGMRLLNPGSPTDRRRQPHATFMTLDLPGGDVVLHRLGA
jgi:putative phosphoesterase